MKAIFKIITFWFLRLLFIAKKQVTTQQQINPESIKKILLIETALLGDVVAATALIGVVARKYPNSRITFLLQEKFKSLVQANPFIESVPTLNSIEVKALFCAVRSLRRSSFDLVVCVSPGVRNALLSLLISKRYVTGYLVNYSMRPYYYQDQIVDAVGLTGKGFYNKDEHITVRALKAILPLDQSVSDSPEPIRPKLYISIEKEIMQSSWLRENGFLSTTGVNIVIHPGASKAHRQWPIEKFNELIARLQAIYKQEIQVTLIGVPSEQSILDQIEKDLPFGIKKMIGYDLDPVMVLLEHCDLFIGNDSGPKFIADAFNRPLVELLGPMKPSTVGALNENSITIYHEVGCNPCPQVNCLHSGFCVTSISVEEVLSAVTLLIERNHLDATP